MMDDPCPIASAASRVEQWLATVEYDRLLERTSGHCVPVVERFDWQGDPIDPGYRRVRVMARQCYVLCQAALSGDARAVALAERVAGALMRFGIGEHGQFVCRLSSDGRVLDATSDAYDIAFGLFALAWWYRLSGDPAALDMAERSIGHLRAVMRSPSGHGFIYRAGEPVNHAQNPQMHLFEAAIMLADFCGRESFASLADDLFRLASEKLHDPTTATLPEHFDLEWRPIADPTFGGAVRVEPGHHYEWVWLLKRYGHLASCKAAFAIADSLYDFARRHGHDSHTGLIRDAVATDGTVLDPAFRIWPNTEFLKAQVAMREHHGEHSAIGYASADIAENVDRILRYYLIAPPQGTARALAPGFWIDHLEADAVNLRADHVPASTLYHIVFAFSELLRHTRVEADVASIGSVAPGERDAAFPAIGWRS